MGVAAQASANRYRAARSRVAQENGQTIVVIGSIDMHVTSESAILYFGTPVVLISTVSEEGTANLAPMSSAFWLGWRCMLGLAASSKTSQNLLRTRQCVLNLPSVDQVQAVNRLALTTGSNPVPPHKAARGYRYEQNKFGRSGFTPMASETVTPPRVQECPVQLEAVLEAIHKVGEEDELVRGRIVTFEVRVQRVHVEESILMDNQTNRIDPDKWRPLIMSFQKFYGLKSRQAHESALSSIPESVYRSPDVDWLRRSQGV
jgi:flavin reductase (DIM6/NTAB) family NADH-FMN oxidoreductase RutF